jgi:hypothetical protein
MLRRLDRGEGVLAGEDFCGEMDLARSKEIKVRQRWRSAKSQQKPVPAGRQVSNEEDNA